MVYGLQLVQDMDLAIGKYLQVINGEFLVRQE
jgi:hypothetical protein